MPHRSSRIDTKYRKLQEIVRELHRVVVAFSGGVDSTFLLKVCRDVVGDNVLAVTASSPTTAGHELQDAGRLAKGMGAEHLVIDSRELNLEEFLGNPPDKCYICKKSRFGDLIAKAGELGFHVVTDGENADDHDDYRPGIQATRELGVRSPLREAGLTKKEIRALSRRLGLPTWNKPSYACLATRIPYGLRITPEKLRQIDAAEEFVRTLIPSVQVRVRHHGDTARIEVAHNALAKLIKPDNRRSIVDHFKGLGFHYVAVDLEGYTMGSLNRPLLKGSTQNG
ncbi:MAG: ATP-dependent sacrificial sulfur transferase LarE [Thermodesulfobacteriota bacterium]